MLICDAGWGGEEEQEKSEKKIKGKEWLGEQKSWLRLYLESADQSWRGH